MVGEIAALGAAGCWAAGSQVIGHVGRKHRPPAEAITLVKCVVGTLLLALTLWLLTGKLWPAMSTAALVLLIASGVIGLALTDTAFYGATFEIGVQPALLMLSAAPVFASLGGAIWLAEIPTLGECAAIIAVLAGVAIVLVERTRVVPTSPVGPPRNLRKGLALGLLASAGQASGYLLSRAAMKEVTPLEASFVRLLAAGIALVVLGALIGRARSTWRSLTPTVLAWVAPATALGGYVGLWLAQFALGNASSGAVASTLLSTSPLFALPLGRVFSKDPITLRALGGTLVASVGLIALTIR